MCSWEILSLLVGSQVIEPTQSDSMQFRSPTEQASDASGTGLMARDGKGWDWERVDAIDPKLRQCLPPIRGPDEVGRWVCRAEIGTLRC